MVAIVLLDTCAAVWIGNREAIAPGAVQAISDCRRDCGNPRFGGHGMGDRSCHDPGAPSSRAVAHGAKLACRSPGPTGVSDGTAGACGRPERLILAGHFPPRPGGSPPDRDGARAQGPAGHPRSPNSGLRRAGARGRHRLLSICRRAATSAAPTRRFPRRSGIDRDLPGEEVRSIRLPARRLACVRPSEVCRRPRFARSRMPAGAVPT